MYLVHLISIDLQLSCLFNSHTAKAYSTTSLVVSHPKNSVN